METNLDTLIEAQAEIEILNDKAPSKSLHKLEGQLRKVILQFRSSGCSPDAYELEEMIEGMAKSNNFKTVRIHYQTITPAPDGHTRLVYEATFDKFHCFVYVRAL